MRPLTSVLSGRTQEAFHCERIGDQNLLFYDLTTPCPLDDKTSSVFLWAVLGSMMYPLGVPVLMYMALKRFGVARLAKKKNDNAVLHQMLMLLKEEISKTLSAKIAAFVGASAKGSVQTVVQERATMMFNQASGGSASLSFEGFNDFLHRVGITGDYTEEIQQLMFSYDDDANGTLELPEFLVRHCLCLRLGQRERGMHSRLFRGHGQPQHLLSAFFARPGGGSASLRFILTRTCRWCRE